MNSSGVPKVGSMPSATSCCFSAGVAIALPSAPCNVAITSLGVPAGASTPSQFDTSYPGRPDSAIVGTCGSASMRAFDVTPSTRTLPALMCSS